MSTPTELADRLDEAVQGLVDALWILAGRRAGAQIKAHPEGCACSVHIAKRALKAFEEAKAKGGDSAQRSDD